MTVFIVIMALIFCYLCDGFDGVAACIFNDPTPTDINVNY